MVGNPSLIGLWKGCPLIRPKPAVTARDRRLLCEDGAEPGPALRNAFTGLGGLRQWVSLDNRFDFPLHHEIKSFVEIFVSHGPGRVMLAEAKQSFIQKKRLVGRDEETISAYESLISEFLTGSGKVFADQIEELDLLRFCDGLRERGLSERTVMNYYSSIATFLRSCGIDHKSLVAKEHRPHKEDPDPEAYNKDEINVFLAACNSNWLFSVPQP
jgi:hypothetical protein